jgi:hypothetical protein
MLAGPGILQEIKKSNERKRSCRHKQFKRKKIVKKFYQNYFSPKITGIVFAKVFIFAQVFTKIVVSIFAKIVAKMSVIFVNFVAFFAKSEEIFA